MKKLITSVLIIVSFLGYGQTLQNPTFGNTTTNTIKVKTNSTSTTALDVGVLEIDGSLNKMTPTNLPIPQVPLNYSVLTPNIGGHLSGIDLKLGALSGTTAGISTRVWFTADQTTITAGTFDLTNATSKGTVASHQQTVANDDGQNKYFTTDLIGQPFAMATTFPAGTYAGSLSASTTPTNANQKFTVELYRCNNAGTPIASGVAGAVTGSLGVTVIMIMDSGEVTLANASITNVPVSTNLGAGGFTINAGERIRYHVSAEKVGTAGGVINESVYYGSSYNSFIDVPVIYNSTSIKDVSTVTNGTGTVTDALNTLNTGKVNISGTGTTNFFPMFNGANSVINSPLSLSGSIVGLLGLFSSYGGTGDTALYNSEYRLSRTSSTGNFLQSKIVLVATAGDTSFGDMVFKVKTTASSGESEAYFTDAITIKGSNATVKLKTLEGVGIRQVVADASGNLSATTPQPLKYVALLNQTGTSAPVATVSENTLGGT